jgi:hypothetical protein
MRLLHGLAILVVLNLWSCSAFATDIYAIQQNGDMLFYKHAGVDDGSANWPISGNKIGNGWNFKQVFAGVDRVIYAIQENGDMLFYQHAGFQVRFRQLAIFRQKNR